jgi:hypothetical protein
MPQCGDAKFFQVLSREARQDPLANLILAECRLIPSEAQALQPDHNVHNGAHSALPNIIGRSGESVQKAPIRPSADWEPTLRVAVIAACKLLPPVNLG